LTEAVRGTLQNIKWIVAENPETVSCAARKSGQAFRGR
jgi:hypothetical protein